MAISPPNNEKNVWLDRYENGGDVIWLLRGHRGMGASGVGGGGTGWLVKLT